MFRSTSHQTSEVSILDSVPYISIQSSLIRNYFSRQRSFKNDKYIQDDPCDDRLIIRSSDADYLHGCRCRIRGLEVKKNVVLDEHEVFETLLGASIVVGIVVMLIW